MPLNVTHKETVFELRSFQPLFLDKQLQIEMFGLETDALVARILT